MINWFKPKSSFALFNGETASMKKLCKYVAINGRLDGKEMFKLVEEIRNSWEKDLNEKVVITNIYTYE